MRRHLATLAVVPLLAACGTAEQSADGDGPADAAQDPSAFDCSAATGNEDWYRDFCEPGADGDGEDFAPPAPRPWPVGEKRTVELSSFDGEEPVQLEITLVGVEVAAAACDGPERQVGVLLDLRAENVGTVEADTQVSSLGEYWLSDDGRRVDDVGCYGDETPLSTIAPGQYSTGISRVEVPSEAGSIIIPTAYPYVDSAIEIPAS